MCFIIINIGLILLKTNGKTEYSVWICFLCEIYTVYTVFFLISNTVKTSKFVLHMPQEIAIGENETITTNKAQAALRLMPYQ